MMRKVAKSARPAAASGGAKQAARGSTKASKAADLAARAAEIHSRLSARYPNAHCALDYRSPLQLLIATILSAQCTDKRVNMVTPALFAEFPTAQALADANPERIEELIRSAGFFRAKTKSIMGMAKALVERHGGEVPKEMDALVELPGVGRKTANVVLGNAFDINEGVVVDTHVSRVSGRLGLTTETDPVKIERDLMPLFPREGWTMLSHLFIEHGRTICVARAPKCAECPLNDICPSSRVAPGTVSRAAPAVTPVVKKAPGGVRKTRGAAAAPARTPRPKPTAGRSSPSASARSPKSPGPGAADSRTSSPRPRRPGSRSR